MPLAPTVVRKPHPACPACSELAAHLDLQHSMQTLALRKLDKQLECYCAMAEQWAGDGLPEAAVTFAKMAAKQAVLAALICWK
jgi:hypothetical protein